MGEENKKTNNQVVTTVKESKTNHEKSNKVFYGDGKQGKTEKKQARRKTGQVTKHKPQSSQKC